MQSYHARLMSGQLPALIDPIRLADEGVRLAGTLAAGEMARLRELGHRPGPMMLDWQFERSGQGVRRLRGTIRTQIEMVCGRCLQSVLVDVVAQSDFVLLQSGQADAQDSESLVIDGPLVLAELAEDEILLAMPMSPGHAEGQCAVAYPVSVDKTPVPEERANPFAELRGFKDRKL